MENFYDLLGVRPDDDAETIKKAFRKAAKLYHPDRHGGDLQAAARFRQISQAYEILRDAEQRGDYDQFLEFARRPLRHKLKRFLSGMKRDVVQGVTVGALFAIVLVVGYASEQFGPETSGNRMAGVSAWRPEQNGADRPDERIAAEQHDGAEQASAPEMPIVVPPAPAAAASAADERDRPEMTNREPVLSPAVQKIAVAGRDSGSDVPAPTAAGVPGKTEEEPSVRHTNHHDQPETTNGDPVSKSAGQQVAVAGRDSGSDPTAVDVRGKTEDEPSVRHTNDHDQPETTNGDPVSKSAVQQVAVAGRDSGSDVPTGAVSGKTEDEPPSRHDVPSLDAPSSGEEDRNSLPAADDRHDGKTPQAADANTGGVKLPRIRKSMRTLVAAKRHAPSHRLQQAALENRRTSAADNATPRVYGVGF